MEKLKIKVVELCSGVGCQLRGMQNTPCFDPEVVATSEINKDAVLSYAAIHCGLTDEMVALYPDYPSMDEMRKDLTDLNLGYEPEKDKKYDWYKSGKKFEQNIRKYWLACKLSKNLGDVSRVEKLPQANVWFMSFPCFVAGTPVYTKEGYKPIEEIQIGDMVLTHECRFRKVLDTMCHQTNKLVHIDFGYDHDKIVCTPNHPFYAKTENDDNYKWVAAKDLTLNHYLYKLEDHNSVCNIKVPIWHLEQEWFCDVPVYNLSVEEDESYVVQGVAVHNCTDISVAGKLKGLNPDDNTRSSLIWQTLRLLEMAWEEDELPEYMVLENVKNLVGKRFIADFEKFNELIESFNYNVYWQVLNAKNCGVPQNRERVFAVYIRKDIDTGKFIFPAPFDNGLRLKDVLEEEVDEKYYINTEKAQALIQKLIDDGTLESD